MNRTQLILDELPVWLCNELKNQNGNKVAIGLSGGVDSIVATLVSVAALGKDNVIAATLPYGIQTDMDDSINVITKLGIKSYHVNIEESCKDIGKYIQGFELSKEANINLRSRARMSALNAIAQSVGKDCKIISTINFSKIFVGYMTKYGIEFGDIAPLGKLTRREVIEVGKSLADKFGIEKYLFDKISANGISGSFEENTGLSFNELEEIINESKYTSRYKLALDMRMANKDKIDLIMKIPMYNPPV